MSFNLIIDSICDIATRLESEASNIRWIANKMKEDKDLDRVSDVMTNITNLFTNLRLDLLITRPIREMKKDKYKLILVLEKIIEAHELSIVDWDAMKEAKKLIEEE